MLLAGPSGSGKSRLSRTDGVVRFRLDDFYLDEDAPGLPLGPTGLIDWDDPRTWDGVGAAAALRELAERGRTAVPDYDIATSRRVGTHELRAAEGALIIAEGIFAPSVAPLLTDVEPDRLHLVWLDRPRVNNFTRRLRRDLAEHRKPVPVLLRRGVALGRIERRLRAAALAAGFQPLSMRQGRALVDSLIRK